MHHWHNRNLGKVCPRPGNDDSEMEIRGYKLYRKDQYDISDKKAVKSHCTPAAGCIQQNQKATNNAKGKYIIVGM